MKNQYLIIAAIQMNSGSEVTKNLLSAKKLIQKAVDAGAKCVVLPEMFAMMGIDQAEKIKYAEEPGVGVIQDFLSQQASEHHIWLVGGTIPIKAANNPNKVYASCLVMDENGNEVARYDKIHLFDVTIESTKEIYSESNVILAGKKIIVLPSPFGKLGLAVCYDLRFPEMFRAMHEQNVEVVILPSAFTYTTGSAHWDVLVRARAIENQVYVIASAQTGVHECKRKTYGHSMIVNPWGKVISSLQEEEGIAISEIDLDYLRKLRKEFPVLGQM